MKRYTIRFNNQGTARQAAQALRRRGFDASQDTIDVLAVARTYQQVEQALKDWALHRGALPTWHLMDQVELGFTCPICLGENVQVGPHGWGLCPDCGADEIDLNFEAALR